MSELNVVTHSLATAATLILAGFEPIEVCRRNGNPVFVFRPEAEETLRQFRIIKQDLDTRVAGRS